MAVLTPVKPPHHTHIMPRSASAGRCTMAFAEARYRRGMFIGLHHRLDFTAQARVITHGRRRGVVNIEFVENLWGGYTSGLFTVPVP